MLCDGIPHPHLPCVARSHQLVPDEEKVIDRYAEAEHTWVSGEGGDDEAVVTTIV